MPSMLTHACHMRMLQLPMHTGIAARLLSSSSQKQESNKQQQEEVS